MGLVGQLMQVIGAEVEGMEWFPLHSRFDTPNAGIANRTALDRACYNAIVTACTQSTWER